jgi:hypothetical protein
LIVGAVVSPLVQPKGIEPAPVPQNPQALEQAQHAQAGHARR